MGTGYPKEEGMSCILCYEDKPLKENGYYHECEDCHVLVKKRAQLPWCGIYASPEKVKERRLQDLKIQAQNANIHCDGCNCKK
jgi:hypothetical protein